MDIKEAVNKIKHHTIIISDIHFGSPACQSKELLNFLKEIEVQYLVLNGDIFDDYRFNRLRDADWEAFGQIRKMSSLCEVVWCRGNHDIIHEDFMSSLLGARIQSKFDWYAGYKRLVALHGDRWDIYIHRYKAIGEVLTWIYSKIQAFDSRMSRRLTRWIKKSKAIHKNWRALEKNAMRLARKNGISAIFCGHTHHAILKLNDGIIYGNSGTWESDTPTFLAIDTDKVSLYKYVARKPVLINEIPMI